MGMTTDPVTLAKCFALAGQTQPAAPECEFQAAVIAYAKARGYDAFHNPDSRRVTATGFPDTVIKFERRLVCVAELKKDRGQRPRADQIDWLEAFEFLGVPAYLWTPDDWPEIAKVLQDLQPRGKP